MLTLHKRLHVLASWTFTLPVRSTNLSPIITKHIVQLKFCLSIVHIEATRPAFCDRVAIFPNLIYVCCVCVEVVRNMVIIIFMKAG